jgi:hypothetical protein
VLGADATVERRSGRQITAKGCYRDSVRSTRKLVIHCFGLKWVVMMLLVSVPWSQRVGVAVARRRVPACREGHTATAQDQCGLGPTDDAASSSLAARAAAGVGR